MSQNTKWYLIVVLCIIFFSTLAFFAGFFLNEVLFSPSGSAVVIVENQSSSRIVQGKVEGCDRVFTFEDLSPTRYVVFTHLIDCGDSDYTVQVQTEKGTELKTSAGYITWGISKQFTVFEIHEDGITTDLESDCYGC